MPLTTIHLLALASNATIPLYLRTLASNDVRPLVVSKPVRWIIKPEMLSISPLLDINWDLLLILPTSPPLPSACLGDDQVSAHWSITAGVPSSLINNFELKNHRLLHPPNPNSIPPLAGSLDNNLRVASSTQGLELNSELLSWSKSFELGQKGAVSMLNLLAFKPGKEAHAMYQRYGKAFAESIGSRRGGNAKIVGKVVAGSEGEDSAGWDEIALAHYPTIRHFVDMLGSDDYQEVNHQFRLPALRDTCILCTTELDPELTTDQAKL